MSVEPIVTTLKGVITTPKKAVGQCIFVMKVAISILKDLHSLKKSDIYTDMPTLRDVNSVI